MDSDELRRENQRKNGSGCPECGGYVQLPSGWLPHDPDCKRGQDAEAAALRTLGAPFPVRDPDLPHDPFECPDPSGDHCEQARRRALKGIGIPGLSPAGPARHELVAPEPRERPRARRRTPNYGQDGP